MTATLAGDTAVTELPVDLLTIGEDVRLDEDNVALGELADSIAALGVLQPLVVRTAGDGWEVIAGRRRLAAARIARLDTVPCLVRDLDDDLAFDTAIAENLHRRQLSWIEVALAYDRLRQRGLNQRQIAAQVGKSHQQVGFVLRLLTIPQELQDRVHRREISYMTALDLAGRHKTKAEPGGKSTKGQLTGINAEIATHWRRRHDRLIAGINQVLAPAHRGADADELRRMLDRVLKLDREPLSEQEVA